MVAHDLAPGGADDTLVVGVHAGFIDTDMAASVPAENKISPRQVVEATIEALKNDETEVLADEISRQAKAALVRCETQWRATLARPVAHMAHAIEVSGLTKRFGPVLAVDNLSFTVDEGRVVGFLGPNGAGKTTTLRMLLGLVNPTAGTRDGARPAVRARSTTRCARVGAVLDGGMLHPGRSGRNHLRTLAKAGGRRQRARRRAARARRAQGRRPTGAPAATRSACASGSAWRRRCSATRSVLVLDEPANGLDPQGIRWLRDFLRRLADEGRAVLVSSHVLAEVGQTADDVVVIAHGRSVAQALAGRDHGPQPAAG